ncbi:MerR family transcriptional regulator [Nocardiopsis sp. RSe5-2]|uniref:MerR family transcriptional regulator n=1 Tax=Nocardiopsis endophytica TaxID=3018445 RepID=A0ABT4U3N3_9ACTN|nr:MerR family transcriptional regulator [Nocardiopsis endophytica]MDA2811311.1 MerR family transcriptional regulator [Nocardiopsis endophytica]
MGDALMRIGEVAERTGLSLRTIRHYDDVGVVRPSARSQGGFRLYTEADVARLLLIKRMKPLDFSLEEIKDLLSVLDELDAAPEDERARAELLRRLDEYYTSATERSADLRKKLMAAEEFAERLGEQRAQYRSP